MRPWKRIWPNFGSASNPPSPFCSLFFLLPFPSPACLPPSSADWITNDACVSLSPPDSSTQQHYFTHTHTHTHTHTLCIMSEYRNLFAYVEIINALIFLTKDIKQHVIHLPSGRIILICFFRLNTSPTVWIKQTQRWSEGEGWGSSARG